MAKFNSPLDGVRVAAPCTSDWEQMIGNERARFCGQCNLNVYNLSSMTRSEAESLIARNEGRLCVRFYRRKDGSIITENCPVGLRAIKRKLSYVRKGIASAVLSFFTGLGIHAAFSSVVTLERERTMRRTMGVIAVREVPSAPVQIVPVGTYTMGQSVLPIPHGRPRHRRNPLTSHR
jgi:hypothetical protein